MKMRIQQLFLPAVTDFIVRGSGGVITAEQADMWMDGGMIYVRPKGRSADQPLKCLHPAGCVIRPFAEDVPPSPFDAPPAAPGGKR